MLFKNYRYAVETTRKIPVVYNARALAAHHAKTTKSSASGLRSKARRQAVKARRGVVLCTGGYEYDDELLQNHTMGQMFHRLGMPGQHGRRRAHGAGRRCRPLAHERAAPARSASKFRGVKAALQINMLSASYFYVDQDGKRFCNEKMDNHTCIYAVKLLRRHQASLSAHPLLRRLR